jgi:hypothetical protein
MRLDETIIVLPKALGQEDLDAIYTSMENAKQDSMSIHENDSKITYFGDSIPAYLRDKVLNMFQPYYDFKLSKTGHCAVRYKSIDGRQPVLRPHTDTQPVFPGPRLSVSVQLKKNIDWKINAESQSFLLDEGDAIIFSGTHQVHWRDPIQFKEGDFLDVFLDSYSTDDLKYSTISQEDQDQINLKKEQYFQEYNKKVNNNE